MEPKAWLVTLAVVAELTKAKRVPELLVPLDTAHFPDVVPWTNQELTELPAIEETSFMPVLGSAVGANVTEERPSKFSV